MIVKPVMHDQIIDAGDTMYPCEMFAIGPGHELSLQGRDTFYAISPEGCSATVALGSVTLDLQKTRTQVFCAPGYLDVSFVSGTPLIVIRRYGFHGQQSFCEVERHGRLSYIDGCSDSLLIYPPRVGDPCLNHLHFPPGILQTQHTHPSIRLGVVIAGSGVAWQRSDEYGGGWEKPLEAGTMFMLEENELHSFKTPEKSMDIIAWHPDSDWGPTDANHPMLNRTYINHGQ